MSTAEKFVQMFIAIALFFAVVAVILLLARSGCGPDAASCVQSAAFVAAGGRS